MLAFTSNDDLDKRCPIHSENAYLSGIFDSWAGVGGTDSWTVSNVDIVLAILLVVLDLVLFPSPSLDVSEAGSVATLCSTILGVPFSTCFL